MDAALVCECGFEARGDSETDVVAEIRRHAAEQHGMALSADDARRLLRGAQAHPNE